MGLLRFAPLALALVIALWGFGPPQRAHAQSGSSAPLCAPTLDEPTPRVVEPGVPCWTEVTPYPFGDDGEPVTPTGARCTPEPNGTDSQCHLRVTSMSFRAWNRGVAATTNSSGGGSTAFGVWLWNGTRWYPDPTFPGTATCPGDTLVWAGKLDYWLVGPAQGGDWPRVCRYDGSTYEWQALELPDRTRDRVRVVPVVPPEAPPGPTRRAAGAIRAGTCFAWNDCWLFGSYGSVVRWDGSALRDASPDPGARPWLGTGFTAATSGRDAAGEPFGVAVGETFGGSDGSATSNFTLLKDPMDPSSPGPVPGDRSGAAAPLAFRSAGGAFEPLPLPVPSTPRPGDPNRTDLVAVAFGSQGRGWVAGQPTGFRLPNQTGTTSGRPRGFLQQPGAQPESAPLIPITGAGRDPACAGPAADRFRWKPADAPNGTPAYLWSAIAVAPGSGAAVAAGQRRPATASDWRNDDGQGEPVIVQAGCDGSVSEIRFRIPDRTWREEGDAPLVPAARTGYMQALAITAANDGWAASTPGQLQLDEPFIRAQQRPRLYRLTDGLAPAAPAGDDDESRPVVFEEDPPIFVEAPPEPEPTPVEVPDVTQPGPTVRKRIKLKPAVFRVRTNLVKARSKITLYVTFRVRRPVSIGVQALKGKKVVSSSGIKRFTPKRGKLALQLDRERWPTRIRFVTRKRGSGSALSAPDSLRP